MRPSSSVGINCGRPFSKATSPPRLHVGEVVSECLESKYTARSHVATAIGLVDMICV